MRINEISQDERQRSRFHKINMILSQLRELPRADKIYVFGSVAKGLEDPKDLDIMVDLRDQPYSDEILRDYDDLIRFANRRFQNMEGLFDPFVAFSDVLLVRNDDATGWQRARKSKEILRAFEHEKVPLHAVENLPTMPL